MQLSATGAAIPTRALAVVFVAAAYFVTVFAFAFVMGVARALVIAPRVGPAVAVCVEIPILLAASWALARRLLSGRRFELRDRAAVGGIAFALTMASEALLSGLLRDQNVIEWAATLVSPLGLVGLAGQLGFAAMPVFAGHNSTAPAAIMR